MANGTVSCPTVRKVFSVDFCFKNHRIVEPDDKVFSKTSLFLLLAGVKLPVFSPISSLSTNFPGHLHFDSAVRQ